MRGHGLAFWHLADMIANNTVALCAVYDGHAVNCLHLVMFCAHSSRQKAHNFDDVVSRCDIKRILLSCVVYTRG